MEYRRYIVLVDKVAWSFLELLQKRCTTLISSDQQLHVVHLEPAPREKCEEESEVSPHTICTQEKSADSEPGTGECVVSLWK